MEKTISKNKTWSLLWFTSSASLAKFRLKLKKEEKTTRPVWYGLNPYEFTVEITNIFKGLDLVNHLSEELWTEVCNIVQ